MQPYKTDARQFVARVETMLKKSRIAGSESLERLACRLITSPDLKTAFGVLRTLLNYKYGMPTQPIEGNLTISYTEALAKMRAKRADRSP